MCWRKQVLNLRGRIFLLFNKYPFVINIMSEQQKLMNESLLYLSILGYLMSHISCSERGPKLYFYFLKNTVKRHYY